MSFLPTLHTFHALKTAILATPGGDVRVVYDQVQSGPAPPAPAENAASNGVWSCTIHVHAPHWVGDPLSPLAIDTSHVTVWGVGSTPHEAKYEALLLLLESFDCPLLHDPALRKEGKRSWGCLRSGGVMPLSGPGPKGLSAS